MNQPSQYAAYNQTIDLRGRHAVPTLLTSSTMTSVTTPANAGHSFPPSYTARTFMTLQNLPDLTTHMNAPSQKPAPNVGARLDASVAGPHSAMPRTVPSFSRPFLPISQTLPITHRPADPHLNAHDHVEEAAFSLGIPYSILKSLHEQSERQKTEEVNLSQGIGYMKAMIHDLQQQNHAQKVTLSANEAQIASLQEILHRREEENESKSQLLGSLNSQLEEERAKVERGYKQARFLEQELRILQDANMAKDNTMASMAKQYQDDMKNLDKKHEAHRIALTNHYTMHLTSLGERYEEEQKAPAGLLNTIAALRQELQALKNESEVTKNSFMWSESELASQGRIVVQLRKENADLKGRVENNDKKHDALKDLFSVPALDLAAVEKSLARIAAEELV